MLIHTCHTELPAADAAPEWVHLMPAGTFRGVDGRGPYTLRDAAAVITASMAAGRLPIDENHAIDLAAKAGGAAPARGWIVAMQSRDDGLWGQVEWTPEGRALVEGKSYRGISPSFTVAKASGRVAQLLRAALTNVPNLTLTTLHTQDPEKMDLSELRQALGLAETAELPAIVAAAQAAATEVARHAQQGSEVARLAGELVELQTQLTTLRADQARNKAIAVVDGAIRAGKPIPALLREHYVTRHTTDPTGVETELAAMVSLKSGGLTPPLEDGKPGLTDTDRQVIALMGIDPEAFRKTRAGLQQEIV